MEKERPSKDEIFNAAAELANVEERAAFLEQACGDDSALKAEIAELLENDSGEDSLLDRSTPGVIATKIIAITEQPGAEIGPYKLLQQIGEGGMGVVYMAEQTDPVERRVALKIIKPGMDTRKVIARFEAERQALAMMDHPNIARVLDAGATKTGRPYFVMELVKGTPITEYCDEHHLTPRQRLELFVPVCQAVQHAHQKGIIHRDIKPSNVLVADYDDHPVPKVIDFGVAKAVDHRLTEKTMFTEFGQVLGTFEYMSPEQAKLNQWDIDTRTDVYSLGVLLYELLAGETPFDRQQLRSAAMDQILRIIREEDPLRPSARLSTSDSLPSIAANRQMEPRHLGALLRGDLDWIVMKALEKDRGRRYDTASKLAEDVGHYLNNETVEACPPSLVYQLRKFTQRNRAIIATLVAVVAALLIGTGVAIWQKVEADKERDRAILAERATEQEALRATREAERANEQAARARRAEAAAEEALAREVALRQRAETREAVLKAQQLCDEGEIALAEKLISGLPANSIRREAEAIAPIVHFMGHWHGGKKSWSESANHYENLLFGPANVIASRHDRLVGASAEASYSRAPIAYSMVYLEYAPLLVELGDLGQYEKLRESAISRYSQRRERYTAERMLHASLLVPANDAQMSVYEQWAELVATPTPRDPWLSSASALYKYRRGNYEQALASGMTCLLNRPAPAVSARAHIVLAMSYAKLNRVEEARDELDKCQAQVEGKFDGELGIGRYGADLWADWLIDRVLMREAMSLLELVSAAPTISTGESQSAMNEDGDVDPSGD